MKANQFLNEMCTSNEAKDFKKKKRDKRRLFRKARIAKEIGVQPQDLSDYRMFFVGLEEQTSSGEERQLIKRYRKDYGDKGELLAGSTSEEESQGSSEADDTLINEVIRASEPTMTQIN